MILKSVVKKSKLSLQLRCLKMTLFDLWSFLFQMVVMDEVQKQMGVIASKQKERIDEMGAEIRKLKAMIVKHESRIRTLETKNRDLESQVVSSGGGGGGGVNRCVTCPPHHSYHLSNISLEEQRASKINQV